MRALIDFLVPMSKAQARVRSEASSELRVSKDGRRRIAGKEPLDGRQIGHAT